MAHKSFRDIIFINTRSVIGDSDDIAFKDLDIRSFKPAELLKQVNTRTAAVLLAREIKGGLSGTLLGSRYAPRILREPLAAARFLVRTRII